MTKDEAAAAVVAYLASDGGSVGWEPAVTRVEDAGTAWRVFYNSRAFVESGEVRDALADNWPYLVSKDRGGVEPDEAFRRSTLGL